MQVTIFTDGGARGNPGPAASGVYIVDEKNNNLAKIQKYIGESTNNIAEYTAILEGLSWAVINKNNYNIEKITFFMDSLLAYSQLTGVYKIKNENLRKIVFEIKIKESELNVPIIYNHIPREKNKLADALVNLALDNR